MDVAGDFLAVDVDTDLLMPRQRHYAIDLVPVEVIAQTAEDHDRRAQESQKISHWITSPSCSRGSFARPRSRRSARHLAHSRTRRGSSTSKHASNVLGAARRGIGQTGEAACEGSEANRT